MIVAFFVGLWTGGVIGAGLLALLAIGRSADRAARRQALTAQLAAAQRRGEQPLGDRVVKAIVDARWVSGHPVRDEAQA